MIISWATFENIKYFIFLIPFLIVICWYVYKSIKIAALLGGSKSKMLKNFSTTKLIIKACLLLFGIFLIFLSLLSPQWGTKDNDVKQEGRDILIALDISKSMLAQDFAPNRLEFAKNKIKDLLNTIDSDRLGLILFSSDSFIQTPLTRDIYSFLSFLDQVDVESISGGSTVIDRAIKQALDMFDSSLLNNKKILIIFTDGEDFSKNLEDIKKRAQKENLIIFTIGIGSTEGAPIPICNANGTNIGHIKRKDGSVVISKLNEQTLRTLANQTGGIYIKSAVGFNDINFISRKINEFEKHAFDSKKMSSHENQYPYFVLPALICLLLEWIL